jgi:hypothetical protein
MNTQNLTPEEVKVLHALLGKMINEPKSKIYFNPVNQMIDDILDNFNFNRVQTAMEALDWRWVSEGVPSIDQLKEKAVYLLKSAAELRLDEYLDSYWEEGIINGTGGFQATAYCNEAKTQIIALDLKFVLTEWDSSAE